MNLNQLLQKSRKNTELYCTNDTRLSGYKLVLARAVWLALFCLIFVVYFLGFPPALKLALSLRPDTVIGLARLGLPATFPAIYTMTLDTITFLVFASFAALIVWRRSDDWMVLFASLMLLSTAMLFTAPAFEAKVPLLMVALLAAFAEICQVAIVYLFPDGRCAPRWLWVLLIPVFVWRPVMWGVDYLPNFLSLKRSGENFFYIPLDYRDLMLLLALLIVGIIAQAYRYRFYSTPAQRQQTKWLLLGSAFVILVVGSYVLALNTVPMLHLLSSEALLMRLLSRTINHLALMLLPLTLTFSILRYRLWDIDRLINRTLVYGTLTGSLALVYFGCVIALQFLLHGFTGGSTLAIVASTLAIVILFHPLRRFYRSKYDTVRTLEDFSAAMREEVDLTQLTEQLIAVVQKTMQPVSVSLWLRQPANHQNKRATRVLQ